MCEKHLLGITKYTKNKNTKTKYFCIYSSYRFYISVYRVC